MLGGDQTGEDDDAAHFNGVVVIALAVRAGAVAVAFVALSVLGIYMLVWNEQRPELQRRQEEEQKLRTEFREKHAKALNLDIPPQLRALADEVIE